MSRINGCVALVTGSNRGLGKAFCEHLLQNGAARIYAAARNPAQIPLTDPRIVAVKLDITCTADVEAAAQALAALDNGIDRVLADDRAVEVDARLRADRGAFDAQLQQLWDEAQHLATAPSRPLP